MRLTICAVGKLKAGPHATLIDTYQKRIAATGKSIGVSGLIIKQVEASAGLNGPKRQSAESELLIRASPVQARKIVLDEHGKNLSSVEFADRLRDWNDSGIKDTAFYIGGADGHSAAILEAADLKISFGKATWPHMMVRLMLCEQIYRSITILTGHPYHRD